MSSKAYNEAVVNLQKGQLVDMSTLTDEEQTRLWEERHLGADERFVGSCPGEDALVKSLNQAMKNRWFGKYGDASFKENENGDLVPVTILHPDYRVSEEKLRRIRLDEESE